MKKVLLFSLAATLISSFSFATIRRVGYPGPQVTGVDYADGPTVVTASAANDTVQLYAGASITVSSLAKPLVFLGPGYFLNVNTGLQVVTNTATLALDMLAGASGTIVEGLTINSYSICGNLAANTILQNILFKRCYMSCSYLIYLGNSNASIQNFSFSQCYFNSAYYIIGNTSAITGCSCKSGNFTNCIFNLSSPTVQFSGTNGSFSNVVYQNCSLYQSATVNSLTTSTYFRNCIFQTEPTAANNDVYDYCTFTSNNTTHYITGTSNQYGKTLATLYNGDVTQTGTLGDVVWKLKAGSAAIGYGRDYSNNPIDGGAYGGTDPYRLSGVPPIPAFYQLTSSAGTNASANPYPITFSVRGNN